MRFVSLPIADRLNVWPWPTGRYIFLLKCVFLIMTHFYDPISANCQHDCYFSPSVCSAFTAEHGESTFVKSLHEKTFFFGESECENEVFPFTFLATIFIIFVSSCLAGKDDKGWGMYIDHQRSWFIHCGVHSCRTEGGITAGSNIGVLLDLDKRQITFYVNDEQQVSDFFSQEIFLSEKVIFIQTIAFMHAVFFLECVYVAMSLVPLKAVPD